MLKSIFDILLKWKNFYNAWTRVEWLAILWAFTLLYVQSRPKKVENFWDIVWFWISHDNYSYNDSIPLLPPTNVVCIGVILNTGI